MFLGTHERLGVSLCWVLTFNSNPLCDTINSGSFCLTSENIISHGRIKEGNCFTL